MNSVVLKGKLGAGFNDDRYTLPKDGNPGDILVKTETGSAWEKQEPATSGGRFIANGQQVEYGGRKRVMIDKTTKQLYEAYNSGKTVILDMGTVGMSGHMTLMYDGGSFHKVMAGNMGTSGIGSIIIMLVGNPTHPGVDWTQSDVLWDIAMVNISTEG